MSDDDEPTWGNSVPSPAPRSTPAVNPVPNQRSMPVVGRSTPAAPPQHADYQRQAAQHFGTPPAGMPSYPVLPLVPAPLPPPIAPPVYPNHPMSGVAPPSAFPAGPARESFVQRLMQRGVRGEILRQPWFHDIRQRNADPFVYVSFAVGVVISLMLFVIPSSFVVTVLSASLWVGIGYLYLALGTKLAHQFLLFGICVAGGLLMALRALSTMVALSVTNRYFYGFRYESVAELMVVLLINLAGAAGLVYVGVQIYRGIQKMSHP